MARKNRFKEKPGSEDSPYLKRHYEMRAFITTHFDMPDYVMENLIGFLRENNGTLSNQTRKKEFKALTDEEVTMLQDRYQHIFNC